MVFLRDFPIVAKETIDLPQEVYNNDGDDEEEEEAGHTMEKSTKRSPSSKSKKPVADVPEEGLYYSLLIQN